MKSEWCLLSYIGLIMATEHHDFAANQIVSFRDNHSHPVGILTTSAGKMVNYEEAESTLNKRLILNEFFMDTYTKFNRERIPTRVVHAKGAGAFGYFEVTHDLNDICKAKVFNKVGKQTPVAVRFSPILQERGGIDTSRDPRGFAIKFYTEDGNFDIVGLNMPVFIVQDPLFFPAFVHSRKKNPQTNLNDSNMFWDFVVRRPKSIYNTLYTFSDVGISDGYRHMPGFSIHTYQVVNSKGAKFFVRFTFTPDEGVKSLDSQTAQTLAAVDPDYATRDLFNAISAGNFPSWTAYVQVLSLYDIQSADFDVFDVTKNLPVEKYPLRPLGRLVLNQNQVNYFAEIEQLAFCPDNLVPGILGAPDKLFEARRFGYRDAQNYRLGRNYDNIIVNKPIVETWTYTRDGRAPVKYNQWNVPNYYPNSYNGPVPFKEDHNVEVIEIFEGPGDDFCQPREYYLYALTSAERTRLINNIVASLVTVTDPILKERSIDILKAVNLDLGVRVFEGLVANQTKYYEY
ncbi:catalase-like [Spodoptera litura]|uniref:Catalase-like n=1 Tax=Spodoptera litura TaxID=69820 RepID=A0A9J7DVH8_SPOLT|nr:catalase-like [Spodoptera litura]